jgi:hypothetical protein
LRRQQREAALARLQHEQECCARALQAEEQHKQVATAQAKAVADKADERRRQDVLAVEQRRQESAERAVATAEKALAAEHCHQESAECAAVTAENALAEEQCHQELAERAAETAEKALAMEQRRQESAERAAATAEKALAKEHRLSSSAKMALAEYDALTIASWNAAAVEVVDHVMTMGVMALTELKAAPKLRYGGPPPTHFSLPLTAKEVAELDAATLDKQRQAAAQEKALGDEANEQHRAAARDKALADEANERRRHKSAERATTSATKVLAKDEHNKDGDDVAQ